MSTQQHDEQDTGGLEGLGTPEAEREARPALYPEHEALDKQAATHPEILATHGPDDSVPVAPRTGIAGLWNAIAFWAQYAVLFVWGAGSQSRAADPIERLKRRYGRAPREH